MQRYIAFLRAINVGGHNVTMAELRKHFIALGLARVETFIASGNVIFASGVKGVERLKKKIEKGLRTSLGYQVDTFLRTDAEVAAIAQYQPFKASLLKAASALNVALLDEPLSKPNRQTLMGLKTDIDDFHCQGREVYWLCRKKQSESKFSNAVFEKTLGVRSTFRTLKTIIRLADKYPHTEQS